MRAKLTEYLQGAALTKIAIAENMLRLKALPGFSLQTEEAKKLPYTIA